MLRYAVRRLLQMIPVALGISIVVFALLRFIPGDACRKIYGNKARPEVIEACRTEHSFDKPIWFQYLKYLDQLRSGDLGSSYIFRRPAVDLIAERLPVTLILSTMAILLSILISVPSALIATLNKDAFFDHLIRIISTVVLAMPSFVIALGLMILLSIRWKMFPVAGYGDTAMQHARHLFLPALTLAATTSMLLTRSLRASLLDVLKSDYIRTARGKGLSQGVVFCKHGLPNTLVTYVSILGLNAVFILGGTVIVEQVFALPGIGSLMITAISNRDYEIVQSITLVFGMVVILVNLLVELSYPLIDHRVTYD